MYRKEEKNQELEGVWEMDSEEREDFCVAETSGTDI